MDEYDNIPGEEDEGDAGGGAGLAERQNGSSSLVGRPGPFGGGGGAGKARKFAAPSTSGVTMRTAFGAGHLGAGGSKGQLDALFVRSREVSVRGVVCVRRGGAGGRLCVFEGAGWVCAHGG